MGKKRVFITGATGMVGGCALRICLDNSDVSHVTVIGRRKTGLMHEKLSEIIHSNFLDYSDIKKELRNHDMVLYCLGVYTGTVDDDEFRKITADYTHAFAQVFFETNPDSTFCFLSGQGADQTEKSRIAFARFKGSAEKSILNLNFKHTCIFRPGYIFPVTPRKEPNLAYKIIRFLYPFFKRIYPNIGISSENLAKAMVQAGLYGTGSYPNPIMENQDIRNFTQDK